MTITKVIKPPSHLRPSTKSWFENVIEVYELDEHHIKLLTRCCECLDRGENVGTGRKNYTYKSIRSTSCSKVALVGGLLYPS